MWVATRGWELYIQQTLQFYFPYLQIFRNHFELIVLRAHWAVSAHIWRGFRAWRGKTDFGLKKGLFLRGSLKSRLGSAGIQDHTFSNISIFSPPQLHPETSVGEKTICFRKVLIKGSSKSITLWGLWLFWEKLRGQTIDEIPDISDLISQVSDLTWIPSTLYLVTFSELVTAPTKLYFLKSSRWVLSENI